jgi:CheY-like chemotaxis protein
VNAPIEPSRNRQAGPQSLMGVETLLVVEDEAGVRDLVRRVLERFGYRVLVSASPPEALRIVRAGDQAIRLLISDVVMPTMTGPELARLVTAIRPQIKVLFMSGYTDTDIVDRGVLVEGTPFLQKPFLPDVLARKVREVLGPPQKP